MTGPRTGAGMTLAELFWRRPYALLPLPPLFWAGNLIIGRAYASELPPYGLSFWRWVIASICILPFVWRELSLHWRDVLAHAPVIIACSATAFAGYPVLNYLALHTTPAATAAILNSTLPLMVPAFAWAIAREVPFRRTIAGILLSFVGVCWIVSRGDWAMLSSLSVSLGECLMLTAVACYGLYCVFLRYRPSSLSPLLFLAAMTMTTCVLLAPFWLWERAQGRSLPLEPYALASLLFIAIFSSLIGPALWNRCVATLGPTVTGASFHLVALYSSLLAFLILGEPIRDFHLIGGALILMGFVLAVLPWSQTPKAIAGEGSTSKAERSA